MGVVGRCRGSSAGGSGVAWCVSGRPLERVGVEGETPYVKRVVLCWMMFPSSSELVEFAVNLAGPPVKPNTT